MKILDLSSALDSCTFYPVQVDLPRRLIWFAQIDREMYQRAGFLTPKQVRMSEERYGFNLDDVLLHDLSLPIGGAPSHYIFISAFCCSTLLARLLDRVPSCLVLKEPTILGQLGMLRYRPGGASSDEQRAAGPGPTVAGKEPSEIGSLPQECWQTYATLGIRLLTRTFEPGQTVIVKASDTCNAMGDVLLANDSRSKAVLLSVGLRTFILSVLKDEKRKEWTRKRANFWHRTLTPFPALNAVNVADLNDACKAGYIWLMTGALWDALRKQVEPDRLLPMDGEEVSEEPGKALRKVAEFFALPLEGSRLREILIDPVLNHHSKFTGRDYDAAKRRSDRADWETRFSADADRAMEWAEQIQEMLEAGGIHLSWMARAEREEVAG